MKKYDYILIGTGQATGTIIPELVNRRKSIAVIENDRAGGTCVNYGCSPTKTLVAMARVARLMSREDADISEQVEQALGDEGIRVICSTDIIGFKKDEDIVMVRFRHRKNETRVTGTHVLFAAGRVPNTRELNAEAAGMALDEKGYVKVDDHLKTSVDHIFALGDVNRRGALPIPRSMTARSFWTT